MKIGLFVFGLSAAILVARAAEAGISISDGGGKVEAGDFADFLINQQLVVEATVVGLDTTRRVLVGGCGLPPAKWPLSIDARLRVDRVVLGVADDETIVLTFGAVMNFPRHVLRSGAPVLAWAYRNCGDGWRLWGGLMVRTSSGYLIQTNSLGEERTITGQPIGSPMPYAALEQALSLKTQRHAIQSFVGKGAVALVRVAALGPAEFGRWCQVDSAGIVIGATSRVPHIVTFSPLLSCYNDVAEGDSLLLPIPNGSTADVLDLDVCPYGLVVKHGFCRGLGVPLAFASYALESTTSGLRVKPFVAKE